MTPSESCTRIFHPSGKVQLVLTNSIDEQIRHLNARKQEWDNEVAIRDTDTRFMTHLGNFFFVQMSFIMLWVKRTPGIWKFARSLRISKLDEFELRIGIECSEK